MRPCPPVSNTFACATWARTTHARTTPARTTPACTTLVCTTLVCTTLAYTVLAGAALATSLGAQSDSRPSVKARPDSRPHSIASRKQVVRHIRMLELPNKRASSAAELLRMGEASVPELARALRDPRPEVIHRLVTILYMLGDQAKAAVPALQKLSTSDDPKLAFAGRWGLSKFRPQGITMIADYTNGCILEFDENGKEITRIPNLKSIWGAMRLANGRYLVSLCTASKVIEIDSKGKVYWECETPKIPVSAFRLPSDHTLIVDASPGRVIEVDRKGKVLWEFQANHPSSAVRLPNGNTLVGDYGGKLLSEVDPQGNVVTKIEEPGGPMDFQRFSNGNTLIALYTGKGVVELDPKGKKLLKIDVGEDVECVCRLPNGHTIAGGTGWLNRYDQKGKRVFNWKKVGRATSVQHY